jgi:DNA-binding transcriptional ArsR family regulator
MVVVIVNANPANTHKLRATRVRFTSDDVVQTRFCQVPGPLTETVLAFAELRSQPSRAASSRWSRQMRRALPVTARPLLELIPERGSWPEFLHPPVHDVDEGLEMISATPRAVIQKQLADTRRHFGHRASAWVRALADGDREARKILRTAIRDFYAACVAPCWPTIIQSFRADVAQRSSVLAEKGLAELFNNLHEDLAWRDQSLERSGRSLARAGKPGEFWLNGRGLLLVPSALWTGPPLFSIRPQESCCSVLIYPARPVMVSDNLGRHHDLADVLGATRAAVLRALRNPCGTAELAARLGISPSSASEHAASLRGADLIQTVRCGHAVRHSLTPLGRDLLNGR